MRYGFVVRENKTYMSEFRLSLRNGPAKRPDQAHSPRELDRADVRKRLTTLLYTTGYVFKTLPEAFKSRAEANKIFRVMFSAAVDSAVVTMGRSPAEAREMARAYVARIRKEMRAARAEWRQVAEYNRTARIGARREPSDDNPGRFDIVRVKAEAVVARPAVAGIGGGVQSERCVVNINGKDMVLLGGSYALEDTDTYRVYGIR